MKNNSLERATGLLFILGAMLVNIPYMILIATFEYPDILRQPPAYVLETFAAGGNRLILTWLAFAWLGLPLLLAIVLLPKLYKDHSLPLLRIATTLGVIGAAGQIIGLLRWVFVVPVLAQVYLDPTSSPAAKEAALVVYQAFHQFGGVLLGEHIGQLFTIFWMFSASLVFLQNQLFRPWLAWLGFFASVIYFLAQGELLATVIPGFPVIGPAGLLGSLLWLGWMIALGVLLLRTSTARSNEN
jgi:hypothetical protein